MRSKFVFGAALAGMALVTAACGSSGSSSDSKAPSAGPASGVATSGSASGAGATSASVSTGGAGSLTIGSADFSENTILAYVYGDALAAKGVKVSYKVNIGERPVYMAALKDGSIDFIPEYSGSILSYLDSGATAKSPTDVAVALRSAASGIGLTELQYAPAQDSDTVTVTKATAAKYHLTTLSSLAAVAAKITFGAPPQFDSRADGIAGLKKTYGITFKKFTPLAASGLITQNALKNGSVQAADIFSTDPSIVTNGFVSLIDDKSNFAAQNIVPLVSTAKVTDTITTACNAVSAKLSTLELAKLVDEVQNQKKDPQAVAKAYDQDNGLI
jgi:osmoprotectant transport system substrate-binding protein